MFKFKSVLLLTILCASISCVPKQEQTSFKETVSEYYKAYQSRSDFDHFLSFYEENVVLEDIITADRIEGRDSLAAFFDWNNPNFALIDSVALQVDELILDEPHVVAKGYFTPFKWGEYQFEAMHFTTMLTFNEKGKIVKQVDWINYPSTLLDYASRKNSNEWLK